jgi:hypothetical protein
MKLFAFSCFFFPTMLCFAASPVRDTIPPLFQHRNASDGIRSVAISFLPFYGQFPLLIAEDAPIINDSLQIETFKCYITQVELYQGAQLVFAEAQRYHLLDAADARTLEWTLPVPENLSFTHIQFNIGIDSLTNCAGAFGGDLDPTNGMYWTWQSGYINVKLEGIAPNCPTRQNRFQFHIGGYAAPFNTLQQVRLAIKNTRNINIAMAIAQWLSQLDLSKQYQVMSPNAAAVSLSEMLPEIFTIR